MDRQQRTSSQISPADREWSSAFPGTDGLTCLGLLDRVQVLQKSYAEPKPVTPVTWRQFRQDDHHHTILYQRFSEDLDQLRSRLPRLLEHLHVQFDDRKPRLQLKIWKQQPPAKRGPRPRRLPSRFEFEPSRRSGKHPSVQLADHLRRIVDKVADLLLTAAFDRDELIEDWAPKTYSVGKTEWKRYPHYPINDFNSLKSWLEELLHRIKNTNQIYQRRPAAYYLPDAQRELLNAHWYFWIKVRDAGKRPEFEVSPANIREAELSLMKLIDWLAAAQPELISTTVAKAAGAQKVTKSFRGKLVIFEDRVELDSVKICRGDRGKAQRAILKALNRRASDGEFCAFDGRTLSKVPGCPKSIGSLIRCIRRQAQKVMAELEIQIGHYDVVDGDDAGYRYSKKLTVQEVSESGQGNRDDPEYPKDYPDLYPNVVAKRRAAILNVIETRGPQKRLEIEAATGIPTETVKNDIKFLTSEDKIEFVGTKLKGHYQLKPKSSKPQVRQLIPLSD